MVSDNTNGDNAESRAQSARSGGYTFKKYNGVRGRECREFLFQFEPYRETWSERE